MIRICLSCPKKKCTGECNRVRTAETGPNTAKYKCDLMEYTISELCQLTGYMHKSMKAKLKTVNYDAKRVVRPEKIHTHPSFLYECFGLTLRPFDWAALLNTNPGPIGRKLKNGVEPKHVFKDYAKPPRRLQMDKFKAKFVSSGQPQPFAHRYTNFEIYTKESEHDTVNWAFECLYPRRVPEMNEWLKNINDPASDITPDYYYKGYYQIFKEDYGYYFSIVEPYTD